MNEDKILKALKKGISPKRISDETGIALRTLWYRIEHDKEYKMAYEYYKTWVDNYFSTD